MMRQLVFLRLRLANAIELAAKTDALLLDLRPVEEYEAGHLPKALNLPIDEFDQKSSASQREDHHCLLSQAPMWLC
ncbi:MAG: rhodanese-like domain-containing protein [Streptococcus sp.]